MGLTLAQLASHLGCEFDGDASCLISGVATLVDATSGDLSFLVSSKYRADLAATQASVVVMADQNRRAYAGNVLIAKDPYLTYARAAQLFYPERRHEGGVHPAAVVDPTAQIDAAAWVDALCVIGPEVVVGANAQIGAGCILDRDITIGRDCRLLANVTIHGHASLGERCVIQPGVVIGSDGFGYANDQGKWVKIPQVGGVILGDDVEVGANTTIDRGALSDTIIGNGVILDNQVQIAHNVHIGEQTAIAGCTGVAGSTHIGKRCAIGGHVGIVGHLTIADGVHVSAKTFVSQSIDKAGFYSSGTPIELNARWRKNFVRMKQLDEMARRIKTLEKMVHKLSNDV
ncbi:MAG: UDP-3-O-(3-hydroxymyristoyl)glucosamine N-acyltransferase [Thiotrichaceae bacterium]|nr:UDP-3-O-(3-hydroxymyristoyl)glucosamine N-acyltransferase [Thiotrichaceae bacterium]PCI14529.1 MAG: UDP-3-O-(3-hydroxymyristoyl)glucosamine N-acyltransferase [Thiotrichales bacterium]